VNESTTETKSFANRGCGRGHVSPASSYSLHSPEATNMHCTYPFPQNQYLPVVEACCSSHPILMSHNHRESHCIADTFFGGNGTLDKPIEVEQVGIGTSCQDDLRFHETCYGVLKIESSSSSASGRRLEPKLDARWLPAGYRKGRRLPIELDPLIAWQDMDSFNPSCPMR
jgi:hypothetical protein